MQDFEKLGKYEVDSRIGRGSFGVVYLGRDPHLKRKVAIKVCSVDDDGLRRRFFREAEISGQLQHRNIVTVFAFGLEAEVPYLVQEYLTGEDLDSVIRRREPLSADEKVGYLLQVAEGLESAHSMGVVHRDIKPANIRRLENGTVKIMDFGIAKLASAETQLTQKGVTMGTASYLPPEQVRGAEVDHRADIFSFGVLAYELLTYERPFRGKTLSALVYQILYKVPTPLSGVWGDCPEPLSDLVSRCLEKKPDRRPATFTEVLESLRTLRKRITAGEWPALLERPSAPAGEGPGRETSDVMSQSVITRAAARVESGDDDVQLGDVTQPTFMKGEVDATQPVPVLAPSSSGESVAPPAAPTGPEYMPTTKLPPLPSAEALAGQAAPGADDDGDSTPSTIPPDEQKTTVLRPPTPPTAPPAPAPTASSPGPSSFVSDASGSTVSATSPGTPSSPASPPPAAATPPAPTSPTPTPLAAEGAEIGDLVARGELETALERLEMTFHKVQPGPPESRGSSDFFRTAIRDRRTRLRLAVAAGIVLAVVALVFLFRGGDGDDAPVAEPVAATTRPPDPAVAASAGADEGMVAVHGAPWARITEITDSAGYVQPLPDDPSTPAFLHLPEGRYTLRVEHPEAEEIQTCEVEVVTGQVGVCEVTSPTPSAVEYFRESGWWQ